MQIFKFKYVHLLVCAVAIAVCSMNLNASGTTVYIAQTAGVFSGGSACNGQSAESIATFNAGTEAAGNTYYFCGTITTTVTIHGSGASGNPITFKWDSGARISQPVMKGININGSSAYLLFDGGTACGPKTACDSLEAANMTGYATGQTGIMESTANGSGLANQTPASTAFFGCNLCHDIEIRNLIIRNLYIHSSTSDQTMNADTGDYVFQCPGGSQGCGTGTISIHDNTIHDAGNSISIERTTNTTLNIYNNDFYRNNWGIENSGNGTRIVNIYSNYIHDANNWDTSNDFFHHNFLHNYMNVSSDSLALNVYNNYSYGNWGSCCTTATLIFTETDYPNNFNVFNNMDVQACGENNTAPSTELNVTTGVVANNTFIGCSTQSQNVEPIELFGTGYTYENNVTQGYGQYVVVQPGATFTSLNYNIYGPVGLSGNSPWSWHGTSIKAFAAWQSSSSGDANGKQSSTLALNSAGQPQSGSVLINNGANLYSICSGQPNPGLGALCSDNSGNPRPSSGAWTAGAFNQASTTGPAAPTGVTGVVTQ